MAGIERHVRAHGARQLEPARVEVARDDERGARGARHADREAADRAAAEHEDGASRHLRPPSTVWTALPIGSMMAPISVGMPSSFITLEAGIAM